MNDSRTTGRKVIPILAQATDGEPEMVWLYEAHQKIYPRSVSGLFSNWRWGFVFLTQLVFYGLPWLEWGQRQAVLFDLGARRFYIFNLVLYPQDFIYLTGLLVISALSLFLFTAVAGRLWCGYACPQTVYTEIFLWIEKKLEGDRSARMRRDAGPWSADKLLRKGGKHAVWLLVALWTGFTFVGYFTPVKDLGLELLQLRMSSWEVFWTLFFGFATYGNAGFMREQVCKHMCPYARFQSAMFDQDTLIIAYEPERGEPRGKGPGKGHCVDCSICVQVCPTGIDIRNGLQYECIGCAACIDGCDQVMEKVGFPKGLIRYSTTTAMQKKLTRAQMFARAFRPRVLIYASILGGIVIAAGTSLWQRVPLKVDVIRDRAAISREVEGGMIENVYRLQIMNTAEAPRRFDIEVSGLPSLALAGGSTFELDGAAARMVPVRVRVQPGALPPGTHRMEFGVRARDDAAVAVREKSVFIVR